MQCSLELVRWSLHSWSTMMTSEQGGLWVFYVFQKQKPAWLRGLVSQNCWVSARRSLGTQYTWKSDHSNDAIWRKCLFSGTDSVHKLSEDSSHKNEFYAWMLHTSESHPSLSQSSCTPFGFCLSCGKSQKKGQSIHLIWLTTGQHFYPS